MKKILIRADDLGYSRSVNYGIYDAVHLGVVNNVGVMVNMPNTKMGLNLLKNENIDLGMHTNISNGKPISAIDKVPSLVDSNGFFKRSKIYRENFAKGGKDFIVLDEVVTEIDAQYHQFLDMVGHKPAYFEGHAVMSPNFRKGLKIIAKRYNLPFLDFPENSKIKFKLHTRFQVYVGAYKNGKIDKNYDPFKLLQVAISHSEDEAIPMIVSHVGYLDHYLLTHSSLTIPRTKEAEVWTNPKTRQYICQSGVKLIRYSDCN